MLRKNISNFLLFLWIFSVNGEQVLQGEIDAIRDELRGIIVGRKVAHMVRGVFHDCVGGCDGCLNRNRGPNRGCPGTSWIETINDLDELYDAKWADSGLSRADVYVLAGEVGIENAVNLANQGVTNEADITPMPNFKFRYGRQDCDPAERDVLDRPLPGGHLDTEGVFSFYRDEFGFNAKDTVAIMGGGHTLGCSTGSSGWVGCWKGDEASGNKFDNDYFKFMDNPAFTYLQEAVPQPQCSGRIFNRFQWNTYFANGTRVQDAFNLNADMAILKNFTSTNGQSSCTYETCALSEGAKFVKKMAESPKFFIKAFEVAWRKMVQVQALKNPIP